MPKWFTTTDHNRSLLTPKELKKIKNPGESFRIVLEKSENEII